MEYTKEELHTIENYKKAVDEDIVDFVNKVYKGETCFPVTVGILSERAAKDIEELTGKKVFGNRIILDKNGVIHIKNRHGENGTQSFNLQTDRWNILYRRGSKRC